MERLNYLKFLLVFFIILACSKDKIIPEYEYVIENSTDFDILASSKDEVLSDSYFTLVSIPPKQKALVKTKSANGIKFDIVFKNINYISMPFS